ncbi:MAG: hypothetical protein AAFX79_12495 [Planctomycetota bacterium]
MVRHGNIPLDDMPDDAIERRAAALRGDVAEAPPAVREELDEGPSLDDLEKFSGVTQSCWRCGTELYDDATVCWHCNAGVGPGSKPRGGTPWWAFVVAILALAGFVLLAVF